MSKPRECQRCEPDLPCVAHMSIPELLDEIATFEPGLGRHEAWQELCRRVRAAHPEAYRPRRARDRTP